MKFNAPAAASFRSSSLRNSGTRWCKSSILKNGPFIRSRTIAFPDCSLRPFTYRNPRRSTSLSKVQGPKSKVRLVLFLTLDFGLWTLDLLNGLWTLDFGLSSSIVHNQSDLVT